MAEDSQAVVTLSLVTPQLEQLAARVNDTVRQARTASTRTRQEERRIRSFIADISHDLRTPLTTVRGYLQLLERTDLDESQRERLAIAHRQTVELGASWWIGCTSTRTCWMRNRISRWSRSISACWWESVCWG